MQLSAVAASKARAEHKDITKVFAAFSKSVRPEQHAWRVQRISTLMANGIPLSKLDDPFDLRTALADEALGYKVPGADACAEYVAFIAAREFAKVKEEISGRDISICFDGTSQFAEIFGLLVRFVDDAARVQVRVADLSLLATNMNSAGTAAIVTDVVYSRLHVEARRMLATMADRCSVNEAAIAGLMVLWTKSVHVGCYSHTLSNSGKKFRTKVLDQAMTAWFEIVRSHGGQLAVQLTFGERARTYSDTRWWSRWECVNQVYSHIAEMPNLLSYLESHGLCEKSCETLREVVFSAEFLSQLAVVVDAGKAFVEATYILEGDSFLACRAYQIVQMLQAHVANFQAPLLDAVARRLAGGDDAKQAAIVASGKACVEPGFAHFRDTFGGKLKSSVDFFKAARLFNPFRISELQHEMDDLKYVPFVSDVERIALKQELARYVSVAEDLKEEPPIWDWWVKHRKDLPAWFRAASKAVLVQPSSASVERAFSELKIVMGVRQGQALSDLVCGSVIVRYNERQRKGMGLQQ